MARRLLPFLIASFLVFGACGSPPSTVPQSDEPSVLPSPIQSGSPEPSFAGSPTPASASPAPTATSSPGDSLGTFACALPTELAGSASGSRQARPTDVRLGAHSGYDRIVFEYGDTTRPSILIERATPPFKRDPSDLPLPVRGSAFLRIRLTGVQPVYSGPLDFNPSLPKVVELVRQGDFEAVQSWIVGLNGPGCARLFVLTSPERVVVDIASQEEVLLCESGAALCSGVSY
jgi:hypothetical protein